MGDSHAKVAEVLAVPLKVEFQTSSKEGRGGLGTKVRLLSLLMSITSTDSSGSLLITITESVEASALELSHTDVWSLESKALDPTVVAREL